MWTRGWKVPQVSAPISSTTSTSHIQAKISQLSSRLYLTRDTAEGASIWQFTRLNRLRTQWSKISKNKVLSLKAETWSTQHMTLSQKIPWHMSSTVISWWLGTRSWMEWIWVQTASKARIGRISRLSQSRAILFMARNLKLRRRILMEQRSHTKACLFLTRVLTRPLWVLVWWDLSLSPSTTADMDLWLKRTRAQVSMEPLWTSIRVSWQVSKDH